MQYSPIIESQWSALYSCERQADKIRTRCAKLVEGIADVFNTPDAASIGLAVQRQEGNSGDVFAHINSPVGQGRLRLGWSTDESELVGVLHVEKKVLAPDDKCIWLPTWGVSVPTHGNPYVGTGDSRFQIRYDKVLGQDLNKSLFACGMSMLYAISVKPM